MDWSSQQFSALAADAQYFEAAPPINMLPISSARLAIGGARALSYAGGKVLRRNFYQPGCHPWVAGASDHPERGGGAVAGELDGSVDRCAQSGD